MTDEKVNSAVLEAQHLVKRFHGHAAVSDVSFTLAPGEILGYLGPNGSGKSITLKMLTGLLEPTSGHVVYDGRDVTGGDVEFRRCFGYVPEEPHLYPFLSGREYLDLVAGLRELPARESAEKIEALLDLFGLSDGAAQSISAYSKGMKQKTLLIAALLHDPKLIVLDEPESGLDVGSILLLRHLVRLLAGRGKAILYSSHVVENVERLCSRVIVLSAGRVIVDGSVNRIRTVAPSGSLEESFATLAAQRPDSVAAQIADVVTAHG
ncbi:MAG TPA: ABC transporter ATP-binding protein [Vicinamibacterales bacterium]|nr:ABC transporter ATP-binding protein [Vicinamibacterales bacterium]